jgi:radical SAM protein with 4Fe4S-binding SPASM domain
MLKTKNEVIKPRLVAFEVTHRCRFNCLHCRASAGDGDKEELTTQQCKKIISSVAKFSKCVIILTGGEPMERSDIYQLIRYGRSRKLRMVMATCGYLINEESIAKLKEAGVLALSFSLDGSSAETHDKFRQAKGAFDAVIRAAEIARQAGMRFQINTTICKVNIDEITGIIELAKRLGAYCFNAFILVPTGRGEQIADEILDPIRYEVLLNELLRFKLESSIEVRVTCGPQFARVYERAKAKKLIKGDSNSPTKRVAGCMGGRGFGFISYRGDVQTCGFLDISAGNLVENGFNFKKIWLDSKFLNEIRDPSTYKGACSTCEYLSLCGGCRARAYAISGDYLAADPICNYKARKDKD